MFIQGAGRVSELQTRFCYTNGFMTLEAKGAETCYLTAVLERVIINLGTAELLSLP